MNIKSIAGIIAVPTGKASELLGAGLSKVARLKPSLDALTHGVNTDGINFADPNIGLLFSDQGLDMSSPGELIGDLDNGVFHLSVAEIIQILGDDGIIRLYVAWSRGSAIQLKLNKHQRVIIRDFLSRTYRLGRGHIQGKNIALEASIVLEFSGELRKEEVGSRVGEIQDIRFNSERGCFCCVQRPKVRTQHHNFWRPHVSHSDNPVVRA